MRSKVLITVGTTPFDDLIRYCDLNIDIKQYEVLAQVSNLSKYKTKNIKTIEFSDNIFDLYEQHDIIMSHAGAGSVYNLLELNKKVIFVPNYTMKDNHQEDIIKFVTKNNYALSLNIKNKLDINNLLSLTSRKKFNKYISDKSYILVKDIFDLIKD